MDSAKRISVALFGETSLGKILSEAAAGDEAGVSVCADAAGADIAIAGAGATERELAEIAASGRPLVFAPGLLSSPGSRGIIEKLDSSAPVMPRHTLIFSPGFLKLLVLIGRGTGGRPLRAVFSISTSGAARDDICGLTGAVLPAVYLSRKIFGAEPERVNAEFLPTEHGPAWFEAALCFPGGAGAEVELTAPRGDKSTSVNLALLCEDGRFDWRRSGEIETLQFRRGDTTRQIPAPGPPPAIQMIHSMADFVQRGMRPFETLDDARACDAIARGLTDAARRNAETPKRLRVLLAHMPRKHNPGDELYLPSLGIARLTAYLRAFGYNTAQTDLDPLCRSADVEALNDDEAVARYAAGGNAGVELEKCVDFLWGLLDYNRQELLGFSIIDFYKRFQLNAALCLARRAKDANPAVKVVLGGVGDEIRTTDTLTRFPNVIDYVIEGDGEFALRKLAAAMEFGDRRVEHLDNFRHNAGGEIVKNRIVMPKLRYRPCPVFDGQPMEKYRRGVSPRVRRLMEADGREVGDDALLYLPYYNVKGCRHRCLFCGFQYFLDMQPVCKTVRELKELSERFETKYFFFWNTTLNMTDTYVNKLCDSLIDADLGLLWADSARPERITPELAGKLAAAGCVLLNFGLESASDKILKIVRKGFKAADAEASILAVHGAGILTRVNLIAGFFHEQPEDVELTTSFIDRNHDAIDMIGCFNGFYWVEGTTIDPAEIGIRVRPGSDTIFTGQQSRTYDEIGGYTWEEKKEAMRIGKSRIMERVDTHGIFYAEAIDEYDMFYLFNRFGRDLPTIKKYLLPPAKNGQVRDTMFARPNHSCPG